ncbi:hypothetical protein MPH_12884 [Macrophomina phaseolina MS6]|uniref:Uncharacterized protein n=1 Tax=Macrophomina phaseolina (strain MS6) TaxID=1126212 RepID=K2RZZ6_MACPH|nr:hypothetical protein MPH_12884 [Macrophomina phaseolina MS6]
MTTMSVMTVISWAIAPTGHTALTAIPLQKLAATRTSASSFAGCTRSARPSSTRSPCRARWCRTTSGATRRRRSWSRSTAGSGPAASTTSASRTRTAGARTRARSSSSSCTRSPTSGPASCSRSRSRAARRSACPTTSRASATTTPSSTPKPARPRPRTTRTPTGPRWPCCARSSSSCTPAPRATATVCSTPATPSSSSTWPSRWSRTAAASVCRYLRCCRSSPRTERPPVAARASRSAWRTSARRRLRQRRRPARNAGAWLTARVRKGKGSELVVAGRSR